MGDARQEPTAPSLSDFCVYTIVQGEPLAQLAAVGGGGRFEEGRRWKTARSLLEKARVGNRSMPIVLGDATDCGRLLFWGLLTEIRVLGDKTCYRVDRLRRLRGRHSPQELILRQTGKKIAPGFIRPYAICRTPEFLNASDVV
jgi:hypothetical protein